jgi:hypothetical protein
LLADARRLASLLPELPHMAWAARNGLVEGNTEMYHRVGFAFDVFLRGESEGRNGLEALQEVIATGELEDPQGYLHAGFALYREAHLVGLLARSPRGSRGRQLVLESCRRHLVHEANLLIAVQEQALVLQRPSIFTHPVLHALLGAVRPGLLQMTLTPVAGGRGYDRFSMLPEGGNWADFEARMGVRDVTDEPNRLQRWPDEVSCDWLMWRSLAAPQEPLQGFRLGLTSTLVAPLQLPDSARSWDAFPSDQQREAFCPV